MKCDQRRRAPDVQALFMPGSWACAQDDLDNIENIGALTFFKRKSASCRYFYKFPLIISISPSNLSSRNGQPVFFLNFLSFFYFLDATAIFLNFPASFLYFCPEIGGIDYVSSWHLYQTFLSL